MLLICCLQEARWVRFGEWQLDRMTRELVDQAGERTWKELRITGFRNEVFATLEKVVDRLCDTICTLTSDTIKSITRRSWIINCFN